MQVSAKLKYARISPQKCRLVADLVRGKPVGLALNTLRFTPKKGAKLVHKVLESAVANAENNLSADVDELKVQSITVIPISWKGSAIGAIFLRTFQGGAELSEQEVEFCRIVAELTASALRQAHHFERLRSARGGGPAAIAAERERAAMLGFLRRFLSAFGDRDGAWDDSLLATASGGELDRLVDVALTVLHAEAQAT